MKAWNIMRETINQIDQVHPLLSARQERQQSSSNSETVKAWEKPVVAALNNRGGHHGTHRARGRTIISPGPLSLGFVRPILTVTLQGSYNNRDYSPHGRRYWQPGCCHVWDLLLLKHVGLCASN